MVRTIDQRVAATIEGDFVVFLIGARVNRWWKFGKIMQVGKAMTRMLGELAEQRHLGLLHVEAWFGRTTILVQYWRSFEQLHEYARMQDAEHRPAWGQFNRTIGSNGDVGIWHETYLIRAGEYEAIYNNMPEFGLAKAGGWAPATGKNSTARGRLGKSDGADAPFDEETYR
ncbi:MAG TPA: DUF4188 domain-containing protein [Pseudomonadales bacterium]|nr:DUF4188 domain-containing protein [Pseudomonadales bacterium]